MILKHKQKNKKQTHTHTQKKRTQIKSPEYVSLLHAPIIQYLYYASIPHNKTKIINLHKTKPGVTLYSSTTELIFERTLHNRSDSDTLLLTVLNSGLIFTV